MKNYYDLLEVTPKASTEVIEKAYKVLVKKYHPDLYQGEERIYAEEKVKELNEAYKVLSSSFLREQYDLELEKQNSFNNVNDFNNRNIERNTKRNYQESNNYRDVDVDKQESKQKPHKVGTFMSIVDLTKEIFKKRKTSGKPMKLQKEDKLAAIITLVIVVILGIILWFIPATNGFIRSLIPF